MIGLSSQFNLFITTTPTKDVIDFHLQNERGTQVAYHQADLRQLGASLKRGLFDLRDYLDTLPLDKVISVHLAGGSWHEGLYHDWHDTSVPEPVWDLYEELMSRARPSAIILEYQGQAHHALTRVMDANDEHMIVTDVRRAQKIWNHYTQPARELAHGC